MTLQTFKFEAIQTKLQSCITWTKKSSRGWNTLKKAFAHLNMKATKILTPVKTRFTSTWNMLKGMLGARQVIDYLYGEMRETQHLRERLPSALEWEVSKAVEEILSHPCKMVMKAQSQNAHWLLPDAIISVLNLHLILGQKVASPLPMLEDEEDEER